MTKKVATTLALFCAALVLTGCGSNDPHRRGVEAGKAACECYKLEGLEAVENCLNKIEKDNQELLTDKAYTDAVEQQLFECITDGVIDIAKPIREPQAPKPAPEPKPDTTLNGTAQQ